MAEKARQSEALTKIGKMFEQKRKSLGKQYKSREQFIYNRSDELFGSEDWISLRHLCKEGIKVCDDLIEGLRGIIEPQTIERRHG